jgi:hypothetical protein
MDQALFSLPIPPGTTDATGTLLHERDDPRPQDLAPDPAATHRWSIARVARQYAHADVAIWSADDFHGDSLHGTGAAETAFQHLLAEGYEPFWVTREGSFLSLWFRARLPRTAVTS